MWACEAFLGGFPNTDSEQLKQRTSTIIGSPEGFVKISAPMGVTNHVFVKFATAEHMSDFVAAHKNTLPHGLRLKANKPSSQRSHNKLVYGKLMDSQSQLISKGFRADQFRVTGNRLWKVEANHEYTLICKVEDDIVKWEADWPPSNP